MRDTARRAAKTLLAVLALLLFAAGAARANTYYIDSASGSNSNNGTSESTPWKSAPDMYHSSGCDGGVAPTYTHQNGDRFVFKGGSTWGAACFDWEISHGGAAGAQDYYGVCLSTDSDSPCYGGASWPSSGWTKPKFDLANSFAARLPNGQLIYTVGSYGTHYTFDYITFDNFEIERWDVYPSTNPEAGTAFAFGGFLSIYAAPNTVLENLYIHDQVSTVNSTYNTNLPAYGDVYGVGTLKNSEIGDPNGYYTVGGVQHNYPMSGGCAGCMYVYGNKIHDGWMGCSAVYSCHDNEFYNITPSGAALADIFNSLGIHPHVIYEDGAGQTAYYAYNNYVHDNSPGLLLDMFYHSYIFNNVFTHNGKSAIYLVQCQPGQGTAPCGDSSSAVGYVANNTMDMSAVPAGNDPGPCYNWYNGPAQSGTAGPGLGTIYFYNNICIPGAGGVGAFQAATIIGSATNYTMGAAEASTYGFVQANKYSPSSSDSNVSSKGANLTSSCSGILAALCQDASGAFWFGGSYKTRPTGSTAWDLGAFQGQGGGGSTGPPSISISSPSSGTVSGSVNLTASCTPQGSATVGSIQFSIDGNNFGVAGTASPYTLSWNTLTAANGAHAIGAVCTDSNGQTGTASAVTVTVSNSMAGCFVSGNNTNWNTYQAFTTQSGTFTATFTATPNTASQDSVIGLSQSPAAAYGNMAAIIRFNSSGDIDAYQGSLPGYAAVNAAPYSAGTAYTFSMTVNIGAGTYSVSETSPSSIVIATNYLFRPTAPATSLSYVNTASDNTTPDTVQLCNFQIGGTASLTFSPANLNLGNVTVGASAAQTITATTSGGAVNFTSVAISGNSDFTIASNACTGSIPSSCATQIQFAPTAAAPETATVTYTDDATGSPQTVAVSGTGVPATPTLTINPTSLNFGGVQVHSTSSSGPIVLTIASGPVTFTGTPALTGANASDFALASNTCTGSVSAASCQTVVSFTPSLVAPESATLTFTDTASTSPQSIPLTGTGYLAPHPPTAVHSTVN